MSNMNVRPPATVLARLRTETREQHEQIERTLTLMDEELNSADYLLRLEQFYGFYKPVEDRIFSDDSPLAKWLTLSPRKKVAWLEADLKVLGHQSVAQLPLCRSLPPLERLADYFGCMYVLEGATLGGVLISRHVQKKLGVTPLSGGQFFNGYGIRTGSMWEEFRNAMMACSFEKDEQDAVVLSACTTFETLQHWCEARIEPSTVS